MSVTEFSAALKQVAAERGISEASVLDSIKLALVSAYRKDYGGEAEEVTVVLDPATGEAQILKEGEDVTPAGFGRIAAQTAKQVILQKIRETEKGVILDEFKSKVGTIISGHVFRIENGVIILDLGKAHGILPQSEQVSSEQYRLNQRLKVLIKDIRDGSRGTEIIVSRADADFIRRLFEQEVPEIASGVVVIKAIAREPGSRTKMAVYSNDEKIDPVGSCVGQKGVRVQAIISEIFGEKIDIIPFSTSTEKFVAASLSPAKVTEVELDEENKRAIVSVPEDQQSLAIGKEGQNARLANKLTKWKIDIKGTANVFSAEEKSDTDSKNAVKGVWDEAIKIVNEEIARNKMASDEAKQASDDAKQADADEKAANDATATTEASSDASTEETKQPSDEAKKDDSEQA